MVPAYHLASRPEKWPSLLEVLSSAAYHVDYGAGEGVSLELVSHVHACGLCALPSNAVFNNTSVSCHARSGQEDLGAGFANGTQHAGPATGSGRGCFLEEDGKGAACQGPAATAAARTAGCCAPGSPGTTAGACAQEPIPGDLGRPGGRWLCKARPSGILSHTRPLHALDDSWVSMGLFMQASEAGCCSTLCCSARLMARLKAAL